MSICPHCGYSLSQDRPVTLGAWTLLPDQALYHGVPVKLSKAQAGILYTLGRAAPRTISAEVIAARNGSEAGDMAHLIRIQIAQIRRKLGQAMPIETQWGVGYRWGRLDLSQCLS